MHILVLFVFCYDQGCLYKIFGHLLVDIFRKSQLSALFSILQGRTALWDSILVLCHKIKVSYGGLVRGMHLGSSALSILPLLESEEDN